MKISLIRVGKTKEKYFAEAEEEYIKRVGAYAELEVVGIKDSTRGAVSGAAEMENIKKKEAEEILKKIDGAGKAAGGRRCMVVALDERGKQFTSVDFASFIRENRDTGNNMVFIIGGCYGLHPSVLARADMSLSFSRFTFTHEMIRQMLLEQIYRAFTIITGRQYHY